MLEIPLIAAKLQTPTPKIASLLRAVIVPD